jgi:hypothetical protein
LPTRYPVAGILIFLVPSPFQTGGKTMQNVMTLPKHIDWRMLIAGCVLLSLMMFFCNTMACSANLSHSAVIVKYLTKPIEKKTIQVQPRKVMPIKNEVKDVG